MTEIDDLIVNRKYRGHGFGKKTLLQTLENTGSERMILLVAEWNTKDSTVKYSDIGIDFFMTCRGTQKTVQLNTIDSAEGF